MTKLCRCQSCLVSICVIEAVVVKCYAIDDADKKKRPMRAAFGDRGVPAVVDRKKDVGSA